MNRKYTCYIWILLVTLLGTSTTAWAQQQTTTTGTATRSAVVNFDQLAQYYAAHPQPVVQRLMPEPEDEHRRRHRHAPPSQIHYRQGSQNQSNAGARRALLPVSPSPTSNFEATLDNGGAIPPDTHGAADSNYVITAINTGIHIQTRAGGNVSTVTLDQFWSSVTPSGTAGTFDPRIHYDPYAHRWIIAALSDGGNANSSVLIGMSQTSNPTGNWNLFSVLVDNTGTYWLDFPNIGFNYKWVVFSGNLFPNGAGSGNGARVYVFNKANLMNGTNANHTIINKTSSFTICPSIDYDAIEPNIFAVEAWNPTSGQLQLWKIQGAVGSETMTSVGFPASTAAWQQTGPSSGADFAPQSGTTNQIQTNDDRMTNLSFRNGKLWCAHNCFLPATGTVTRCSAQWWQIDTFANPLQIGRVDDATSANFFAFPSLAVNKYDDALIGFTHFSSSIHPSAAYSLHLHGDPIDSMRPYYTYRDGQATYFKNFGGADDRWGDYSASIVDPVNDADFWTIQECSASPANTWDTWWAHVLVCTPPAAPASVTMPATPCQGATATYTVATVAGATSYTWTVTGSGWTGSTTTNSIILTAGTSAASISVTANDACGSGTPLVFSAPVGNCCIGISLPLKEGFQTTTFVPSGWTLSNPDGITAWTRNATVGGYATSTASATFDNFTSNTRGQKDYMYSPIYSFANANSTTKLKFDYAYQYDGITGDNDSLQFMYSTDCGATWANLWKKGGASLVTTATTSSSVAFSPTAAQWKSDSVSLASLAGQADVQFAVININNYGQFIFVDNINIDTPTGVCSTLVATASVTKPATHCSANAASYTATAVTGATSYTWTVTGTGWSGTSTTNSISITAGTGIATITVKANNACGAGAVYSFQDTADLAPVAPASVTKPATHCSATAATYTAAAVTGATSYTWTVTGTGWSGTSTTNSISITAGTGIATITVKANNACGAGAVYSFQDTADLAPVAPASVTKPATHCSATAATYTAAAVTGATSYTWTVTGTGWSGTSTTNSISITAGTGIATITVKANNACGTGAVYSFQDTADLAPVAPASVTKPATHCSATAASYTAAAVTGATSYTWTVTGTGWSGTSTTNSISITAGTGIATITVKANNACGAGAVYSFQDTADLAPVAPASVTKPATHCSATAASYTAAAVTGATSYTWTVTGTGWSGTSTTNSISITAGTGIATITVKANNACGAGAVYSFQDTADLAPVAPASVTKPATHCSATAASYTAAAVTGATSYTWTVTGTGWSGTSTTNSISITAGTGIATITVKANNACGAGAVYSFQDTADTAPNAPASVTLPTAPCNGANAVYTVPTVSGATSYTWSYTGTGWSGTSTTNSITLTAGSVAATVSVTANNACGSSTPYTFNATLGPVPNAPTSVTLPTAPCNGSTAVYTVPAVSGATSYTWSYTGAGWSGTSTTNSITLTAGSSAANVSVTANNACGSSTPYTFNAPLGPVPNAPTSVTLPTAPCNGANAVYTVPTVSGATSYTWSYTGTGWSGTSTTNSITLTAGSGAATVSVTANNACGSSTPYTFNAPLGPVPNAPASVTLPAAPCTGATAVYTVPTISGATSYTWSYAGAGWSGTSTTNSITLTAGSVAANVSVTANNACGSSTPYTFNAPLGPVPNAPASVTLPTAPCNGANAVYTVPAVSGATSYTWSYTGTGWSGSSTTNSITLTAGSGAATVSVTANNACGSSTPYTFNAPHGAVLPSTFSVTPSSYTPCPGASVHYVATPVAGATSYTWSVNGAGWSGSSTVDSIILVVGSNTANVTVTANNACGAGSPYTFNATNTPLPATPTIASMPPASCTGSASAYSVNTVPGATSYTWSYTGTGWSGTSTINTITLTSGNVAANVTVTANNICGSSSPALTFNAPITPVPNAPTSVTLLSAPCSGSSAVYTVPTVSGATSYTWSYTGSGWSGTSTTNSITLTAGSLAANVSVTANNACGPSTAYSFNAPLGALPVNAPLINTITPPCSGINATYTCTALSGISNYVWQVSGSGWSGTSTTTSINVAVGTGAAIITCRAQNGCGTGQADTIRVSPAALPGAVSSILAPSVLCLGDTGTFSTPIIANASSYIWTVNGTGAGWSGNNSTSNSILVTSGSGTGSIIVMGNNACGNGTSFTLNNIAPTVAPTSIFTISSHTTNPNAPVTVTYTGNGTATATYTWNFDANATANPGTGQGPHSISWSTEGTKTITLTVRVNGCKSTITDTVNVTKANGIADINIQSMNVSIVPNPNSGTFDITFDEAVTKPFIVKLTDVDGRSVYSKQFNSTTGNKVSIATSGLPAAVYVATITMNGYIVTRKVVINK